MEWKSQRKAHEPSDWGNPTYCHFQGCGMEKSAHVREGERLTVYRRTQWSNRCSQGHIQKRGWSPIRYTSEAAFISRPWGKGLWLKEGMAEEGTKALAVFQKGGLAPHTIPFFNLLENQHIKEASHSCSMLNTAYQADLLSSALMETTDAAPQVHVQSTLRFLTSIRWNCACGEEDLGSIPWLGRSPGEGKSKPLQYPCLENASDRVAWWAVVHGIAESWARRSS